MEWQKQGCYRCRPAYNGSGTGIKPGEKSTCLKKPADGPAAGESKPAWNRVKNSFQTYNRFIQNFNFFTGMKPGENTKNWKLKWNKRYFSKKFEAGNVSFPGGNVVHMIWNAGKRREFFSGMKPGENDLISFASNFYTRSDTIFRPSAGCGPAPGTTLVLRGILELID